MREEKLIRLSGECFAGGDDKPRKIIIVPEKC